jgi:hypothetical protein
MVIVWAVKVLVSAAGPGVDGFVVMVILWAVIGIAMQAARIGIARRNSM